MIQCFQKQELDQLCYPFQKHNRKRDASPGHQALAASLRMDLDYDVRTPNDYIEFKALMRSRREAVKQVKQAQRAEEARGNGKRYFEHGLNDEDESASEAEGHSYRRSKMGKFAPPAMYHQASATQKTASASPFDDEDEKPYLSPPPPSPPPLRAEPDRGLPTVNLSGEEAYQRRLAMSQTHAMPVATLQIDSAGRPSTVELAAKAALAASIAARLAKAAPLPHGIAPSPYDDNCEKSHLSPHFAAVSDGSLPPVDTERGEDGQSRPPGLDLAAKAALAASVAARLGKVAPSQGASAPKPAPPSFISATKPTQDSASFAEKLMEKQGWKRGEALGADGNKGLLDPILAEKVESERRRLAQSSEKPLQSNRGTIINAREDDKRREEREKYGTVSIFDYWASSSVSSVE